MPLVPISLVKGSGVTLLKERAVQEQVEELLLALGVNEPGCARENRVLTLIWGLRMRLSLPGSAHVQGRSPQR